MSITPYRNLDEHYEMCPAQRAALVTWWLAHGEVLTVEQVAALLGLRLRDARHLLRKLAEVLPVAHVEDVWFSKGCDP